MADYQRIVEYLRDIRAAPPSVVTEELRQYAAQYAELCVQANERLRRCSGFLQQGLRSEAIHLSEDSPNLLDLVAALDLPDAEIWAEFCRQSDLAVPPPIQMDRATQLNEAYAAEQPLEALFEQHRLLALARGPVRDRLALLRQIAALDPGSAFWEKDLRVFEKARLRELPTAFLAAVKNRDYDTVSALYSETHEQPWLEAVPSEILSGVADAFGRMRQVRVEEQLRGMLDPLKAAHAAGDLTACVAILKQWKDTMDIAGVEGVSPDLARELEPITAWTREQGKEQQRQKMLAAAVAVLSDRITAAAPEPEIEAAYQKAKSIGDLSPDVQKRYDDLRRQRSLDRARRFKVRLATIAAIFLVVVLLAGGGALIIERNRSAASWAGRIHTAVGHHDWTGLTTAEQLIKDLHSQAPQLADTAEVKAAISETTALRQRYDADNQALQSMAAALIPATTSAQQAVDTPNAPPGAQLQAAAAANDALAAHEPGPALVWADHSNTLANARAKLTALRDTLRQSAWSAVQTRAADLSTQVDDLIKSGLSAPKLTAFAEQTRALADLPGLNDAATQAVADLRTKIEQAGKSLQDADAQHFAYTNLANHAASADDLAKSLQDFLTRYPAAPAATDFKAALDLAPADKSVEAWGKMVAPWPNPAPDTAAAALQRLTDVQTYIKDNPNSPLLDSATHYVNYLTQAAAALAEKGAWQDAFKDLLEKPLITDLASFDVSDGARYYVLGDYNLQHSHVNESVSVSFEALDPADFAKRQKVTIDPPKKLTTEKPVPLPHALLAAQIAQQAKLVDDKNWDTFGIDLSAKLAKDQPADSVIRAMFLQAGLTTETQLAGWALGDLYSPTLRALAREELDKIVWFDPVHPVPEATRQALKSIFAGMPTPEAARKRLDAEKQKLFRTAGFSPYATGILLKDDQGQLVPHLVSQSNGDQLFALAAPPATDTAKPPALILIGTIQNNQPTLLPDLPPLLPAGTMIFVVRP